MRINVVSKARKDQGNCGSCGQPILAGTGYRYIAPRYGGKKKRHLDCPSFRPSEMTSSKIATAYAAQEGGHDDIDSLDGASVVDADTAETFVADVKAVLTAVAEGANECAGDYQDGYDNMPENFQAGPTGEEIQEKVETLEGWASELEDWSPDLAEPPTDEAEDDDAKQGIIEQWVEDVLESARAVIDSLEL